MWIFIVTFIITFSLIHSATHFLLSRVDHLYAFFVHWSPEVYGKDAKDQGFMVVKKDELEVIDNFFSDPVSKSWEVSYII